MQYACVRPKSLQSCLTLCDPMITLCNPLSTGFSGQDYWSGLLCPPPGDLPDSGMEPMSLLFPELANRFFITSATSEAHMQYRITFI